MTTIAVSYCGECPACSYNNHLHTDECGVLDVLIHDPLTVHKDCPLRRGAVTLYLEEA